MNDRAPRRRSSTPWIVLAASVLLVVFGASVAAAWVESRAVLQRERTTAEVVRVVERRMDAYVALLRGAAALFAFDEEVDREGFARFAARLRIQEYPGIQGLGWTARLGPEEAARVVRRARAEANTSFALWPERPPGDERYAILFLEPLDERNRAALGYDMSTEQIRREAMERARDTGRPSASGMVRLVQEIDEDVQPGFLLYVPVYAAGELPGTVEARRERLRGFVYAPFRARDLFGALLPENGTAAGLTIHDGPEADPERELFAVAPQVRTGPPEVAHVEVAGRPWTLVVRSRAEVASDARVVAVAITAVGAVLTLLVFRSAWGEARARARAEQEHEATQAALAVEARHAQFRETFLGVLGHDLRSPLAAVRMSAQMLLRAPQIDETARTQALERIVRSTDRALRMVEQLLDVTRARLGGGIAIHARPLALSPLVHEVVDELSATREERFEVELDDGLEVEADPDRLAQILSNLAGNALAHGAPPLRVTAHRERDVVRVEVTNRGETIPPDVLATLFDPFVRGEGAGSRRAGLGLGLYISQQLAIAHGGSLECESDDARGTSFVLRLPLARGA